MRIALLEEDSYAAELIKGWLHAAGHVAAVYDSAHKFMAELAQDASDLLVVGTCTSAVNRVGGTEVLQSVREQALAPVPLLRICANSHEHEIVAALKAGADDCMATPVRRLEFLARIEALGRRVPHVPKRPDSLNFGDLNVDLQNRVIVRDGQRVALTPKSYDLAVFLFSNLGQLLSRTCLMERIWGRGSSTSTRTLDTHISRLRTDLGLVPENGWVLQSVYQHGYRLEQADPLPSVLKVNGARE
jgi:DNA-binding response OmpR family regulator